MPDIKLIYFSYSKYFLIYVFLRTILGGRYNNYLHFMDEETGS